MQGNFPIQQLRSRKQRIYSVIILAGIVAVGVAWVSGLRSRLTSGDTLLLPLILGSLVLLLVVNAKVERLERVETGLFALTSIPLLLSFAEAMLVDPIDLVDLGDLLYWFPFVYLLGFTVFKPPTDGIMLGAFLLLTIGSGFLHFIVHDFDIESRSEALFLGRFYLSQIAMFAIVFTLFRLSESTTRIRVAGETWEKLALTDGLTGINNRMALTAELDRQLAQVARYQRQTSILMIDVDGFKAINDQFGHAVGDEVLIAVAQKIEDTLREGDFLGRFGGDEFVTLLPEADEAAAKLVAERIRQAVQTINLEEVKGVEISIGISELGEEMTKQDVFKQVDERLYRAKGLR